MFPIFEVLRLIGSVFGTARVVKTINKFSLYGHLFPIKEKHLTESFSSEWPIIAKASGLPSSEWTIVSFTITVLLKAKFFVDSHFV